MTKLIESSHYLADVYIRSENLGDEYPYNLPVVKNFQKINFNPKVTFLLEKTDQGNQLCSKL